jgi:hypothetical protein
MADEKAVLFIGSNRAIVGREQEALKHWIEFGPFLDQQQSAGWFARWDGYWLTPHGTNLNAVFTLYGDRAKLDEFRRTDAFEHWVFRATHCLADVMVVPGVHYNAAQATVARRLAAIKTV